MSDDRFKQARRSLIDRNKQRQQQDSQAPFGDDDFDEDEKTLMVNVDQFQSPGGGGRNTPPASHGEADDFADAATQMVDLNSLGGGVDESTAPHREALSVGGASPGPAAQGPAGQQQVFSPGGGAESGYEGKTDFININDFVQQGAEFAPDSQSAGYEGKTAFVHIDALQGAPGGPGGAPPAGMPPSQGNVAGDQLLHQSYQFGPEAIQQGEVTLIFAQNPLGRQVVLRQVWAGDATQMPAEMRQRIAQIDALDHPRLVKLNGVVATQTGLWADLQRPEGYRLSAVLQQHGAQDPENVATWAGQIAEVLDLIHSAGLVYANLTPDAVWIQEDNSVVLEPFDLLSFERRGDLGEFGAPELKRPSQEQILSPATDVYSLAAVAAAALTGLPFHTEMLANMEDQKLAGKLRSAMSGDPGLRPQTAAEFAAGLSGGGFSLGGLNLAELDIKIVAAIAILLLGGFAGYMYWNRQQARNAAALAHQQQVANQPPAAQQAASAQPGDKAGAADKGAAGADSAPKAAAGAPGEVQQDPRLKIVTSYQKNPPKGAETSDDADKLPTGKAAVAAAAAKLDAARQHIASAKKLASRQDRLDEYTEALQKVTLAIRLNGGKPTDEEQKLLDELYSQKVVTTYVDELRKRIADAIDKGSVGDAKFPYKRLYSLDYHANAIDFFNSSSNPEVKTVHQPSKTDDAAKDKK